ncbi:hypothetical protein [Bifidobacterium panos]|uniref:Uncharacterized protein n=1 Tax=Bifidobacterium panos TaxID=2675321 RepID=A0ABX1T052_9BIFI|nr:hypothetical protein [Bifidobacterium sp. DSM 109963]NMN02792.1 hypothetical protein [Bifidobacterium sp. DSM 109963]
MTWRGFLYDTISGQLAQEIDVPSFTWSMTVSDSSFSTTKDKGVGEDEVGGLELPWSQIPGTTPAAKASSLMCGKRGLIMFWKSARDDASSLGTPVVGGPFGVRSSTPLDVSVPVDSMMSMLANRFLAHEGRFGTGGDHTAQASYAWKGMSLRGIACEVIRQCTSCKPGGQLPIDLPYLGEKGSHERTDWQDWDVQNQSCKDLLTKLANVQGGPDMQFRPYLADSQHVRWRFEAGSDGDVFLGQKTVHALEYHPQGGTLENLTVDRMAPVQRVYATGSGSDKATLCYLAEDMALTRVNDPWPLYETTYSDSDVKNYAVLKSHAHSRLEANSRPLMQVTGEIDADDVDASGMPLHPLGGFWPGEVFKVSIVGFPDLPNNVYRLRLMKMSGDETSKVKLVFDICEDPVY